MTAISLRAAPPALRFGWSTLASVLLHVAVLWPVGLALPHPVPPPPVLDVMLEVPLLATQRQEEPEAVVAVTPAPAAVPPAPTSVAKPKPPRPLQGKALNTALAALAKEDFYPREAIERGIEGDVIVLLTLTDGGRVAGASVATSSGHAILDAAALVAVRRLAGLSDTPRQVLLPVRFRLN